MSSRCGTTTTVTFAHGEVAGDAFVFPLPQT
jgi:hypothetical protein